MRYKWHAFIVDAPETPGVELQSWRFTNHPLRVIGRDYKKRKSALRTSGGDEKLIDVVTAEIDFLEKVYKKTAKTLRVDELMPGMIPHPIEIRGDGLSMLMYIDMGNIGKQWSAAEMKRAFHGSPIETATE